jgi:hypothetical protein
VIFLCHKLSHQTHCYWLTTTCFDIANSAPEQIIIHFSEIKNFPLFLFMFAKTNDKLHVAFNEFHMRVEIRSCTHNFHKIFIQQWGFSCSSEFYALISFSLYVCEHENHNAMKRWWTGLKSWNATCTQSWGGRGTIENNKFIHDSIGTLSLHWTNYEFLFSHHTLESCHDMNLFVVYEHEI